MEVMARAERLGGDIQAAIRALAREREDQNLIKNSQP